ERERFREWREQTRNAGKHAGRAAGRIARRAGRGARHLADEAIDTGGAWREEAESWTERAGHRLGALAEKARNRIQPRRRRGIRRYLPESPWAIGAVCAVVGAAAVGLAVSRTSAGRRLARRRDDLAEDLAEDLGNELSDDFDEISSSARVMARNVVEHEPEELA
ncbi:MAG TPA: hypothetical protein VFL95_05995, partial [Gemmatimonadales bacterium]|nr:hypothetical protein [Gemmatimonadales bacterium]